MCLLIHLASTLGTGHVLNQDVDLMVILHQPSCSFHHEGGQPFLFSLPVAAKFPQNPPVPDLYFVYGQK